MKKSDFEGLMQGLKETRAFLGGKSAKGLKLHIPAKIDVARIRAATGLTQAGFSAHVGVSLATLRNWEQGRRMPDGPARVLLAMLDRDPEIVRRVLSKAA